MKSVVLSLLTFMLLMFGCAKPPEEVYNHPKTGLEKLAVHVNACREMATKFGVINMSPVHQYPMEDMKDLFQRKKVFNFCMLKKGYEKHDSVVYTIDGTTTRIVLSDTELSAGETSQVTIYFSSAVGGLEKTDLEVENGTLSSFTTPDRGPDSGRTWVATFTPKLGLEVARNVIRLDNSGVINGITNPGIGFTLSDTFSIDTLRPTVKIRVTPLAPTAPAEASIPVAPDMPAEASIPAPPVVPVEAVIPGAPDAPAEASMPAAPDAPTEANIPVKGDAPLGAEAPADGDSPDMVGIPVSFTEKDIYAVNIHQRALVNFDFSEPPISFTKDDITVTNGSLGELVQDNEIQFHSIFTANTNFKGVGTIAIKASRFTDMARNFNKPAQPGIVAIDTLPPAITAAVDEAGAVIH